MINRYYCHENLTHWRIEAICAIDVSQTKGDDLTVGTVSVQKTLRRYHCNTRLKMMTFQAVQVHWAFIFILSICGDHSYAICRTKWFNTNTPTKVGEKEMFKNIISNFTGQVCQDPLGIEAETVTGLAVENTRNVIQSLKPKEGLSCANSEQKRGTCENYKVLFECDEKFCSVCRTEWLNADDPGNNGDFELLPKLYSKFAEKVCDNPIAIEAQTINGKQATFAGNIQVYDANSGFSCVDRNQGKCEDYKVRLTCPVEFCTAPVDCFTRWFNSDSPTANGDFETLDLLLVKFPSMVCPNPEEIYPQTVNGLLPSQTKDKVNFSPSYGFECTNLEAPVRTTCNDYKVMFKCPSDFCAGCRTQWFNSDKPTTSRGDFEILSNLKNAYPGKICDEPFAIEGRTVTKIPASASGDKLTAYDGTNGLICENPKQSSGVCQDYEVRFLCPRAFCAAPRN